MNLNLDNLIRAGIAIIIGGLIILGATFILAPLLPLVSIAVVLVLAYLIYKWITTGNIPF